MNDVTIARSAFAELVTQALNPQPLPPKELVGPVPDPWLWTTVSRQLAAGIIIVGGAEGGRDQAYRTLKDAIDDLCGTPPRWPWPIPGPHGPVTVPEQLHAANLLVVAAHLQHTADTLEGHDLQGAFADAAGVAFEAAAARQG